jgi:hypothetical protein
MLVYHPRFLFFLPGALAGALGTLLMMLVFLHVSLFGRAYYVHTLIAGSLLVVVGSQLIGFGLCGRSYAVYQLGDRDPTFERLGTRIRLEHGLLLGLGLMVSGLALGGVILARWAESGLGSLSQEQFTILAATLVIVGVQVFFTSFLLSLIGLRRRPNERSVA